MEARVSSPHSKHQNNYPEELRRFPAWMGTRYEKRPGKPDKLNKPPYRVRSGMPVIKADKTNPENRATFAEAFAALQRGDVDDIGFVFTKSDPHTVVD